MYSLQQKMNHLYNLSLYVELNINKTDLSENEIDVVYGVLDGLILEFVYNHITGKCSLYSMLKWTIKKLELYIDDNIKIVRCIKNRIKKTLREVKNGI